MSPPRDPRPKAPSRPSIPDGAGRSADRGSSPDLPAGPAPPEPLAEVERALSILHGRHPEAVRAERETHLALAAKKAEAELRARRARAEDIRTWLVRGAVVLAAAVAGVAGVRAYGRRADRARAVEGALAPLLAPYVARGFTRASHGRFADEALEIDATDPTCFVVLASRAPGDGRVRVERPGGPLEGEGSASFCTCAAERSTARLVDPEGGGGLAVLRIGASEVGGAEALAFLEPPPGVLAAPEECENGALDAWIDRRATATPRDDALGAELRAALARLGFAPAGSAVATRPFAVVPGAGETCAIAWSTGPDDRLSLRLPGGARPVTAAKGPLGFCVRGAESVTVWRQGSGAVVVERAAASRVGGAHGLRELALRLGAPVSGVWVADGDLAWDASATLRASGVATPEITVSIDGRGAPDARLVAVSLAGALVRPDVATGATYACDPPLAVASPSTVCVQSTGLPWRVVGGVGKAGIAAAALPFWMQASAGTPEPAALAAELTLLRLGRRLVSEGFEATTLEGVTEVEGGAVVVGRAGDDAFVAVQLAREPPWASVCTAGEAWSLDGDPGVAPLGPGDQVKVECGLPGKRARERRTVVFRHPADARQAR